MMKGQRKTNDAFFRNSLGDARELMFSLISAEVTGKQKEFHPVETTVIQSPLRGFC